MLFLFIVDFYFLCIFVTCDEQTVHYNDKIWFILKDASQICSLFSMSRILTRKPIPMNFYIKIYTPKRAKTSQNEPKRPNRRPKLTQNDPKNTETTQKET